jgi:hypothetical protein
MQRALGLAQGFAQPVQVARIVLFTEEARLAIVAALDNMQWNSIELDARVARHAGRLARNNRP